MEQQLALSSPEFGDPYKMLRRGAYKLPPTDPCGGNRSIRVEGLRSVRRLSMAMWFMGPTRAPGARTALAEPAIRRGKAHGSAP